MKELKERIPFIAQITATLFALANQCLAVFGRGAIPFTDNMVYQIVSLVLTVVVVAVACWKAKDVTALFRMFKTFFKAIEDGDLTEEEVAAIIAAATTPGENDPNQFIVAVANGLITKIQDGKKPPEEPKE